MLSKDNLNYHKIGIICDFDKMSGFGHFNRMICLYRELKIQKFQPIFIFERKKSSFIKKYSQNIDFKFVDFDLQKDANNIIKFFYKNLINTVLIDSYKVKQKFEDKIRKHFFTVSIDDRLKKHGSNIVFNSRQDARIKSISNYNLKYYFGKKYLLFTKVKQKKFKNDKIQKILIHAGGGDSYFKNSEFFSAVFSFLENTKIDIDILCTKKKIKTKLIKSNKFFLLNKKQIKFINFNNNFKNKLKIYDVIIGPAGTTTYEALFAGTLSISFPLVNDGRDSIISWNLIGNFLHLTYRESKDKKIVRELLNFVFCEYKYLNKNYFKNSKNISSGEKNIVNEIKKNLKGKLDKKKNFNNEKFVIKKANYSHSRLFLIGRNQKKVRSVSSNPQHIISWTEHLNWWKNSEIKKFVLLNKNFPVAFHWVKKFYSNELDKNVLISGWFPFSDKNTNNLKYSKLVLDNQLRYIKKNYKNTTWIINISKKNLISIKMNKLAGFLEAKNNIKKLAKKIFKIDLINFNIYEMQI